MTAAVHAACDTGIARAAYARASPARPRAVLAATVLASCLALLDGSVVNVGLPAIGRDLHAPSAGLQWLVNAYLLPLSALILLSGAAGDRFGRRRLLIGGVTAFALASALCALAPSLPVMLAARALQGAAAAALMPNSLAVLGASFSGPGKARAIGVWAAGGAMASALGPVLGGWLIDVVGWRAIFLINLPIAAAAVGLTWISVRDPPGGERVPLDVAGAGLATLGLGALTFGLTAGSGPQGWSLHSIAAAAGGLALLGAFVAAERRLGAKAMMPLALFASRAFVGLTALTALLYGAFAGLLVLTPYVLIEAGGYSGVAAGASLLPLTLILALVSPAMGALAARIGTRLPLTIAPVVVAAGFLLALRIGGPGGYWSTVLPAVLVVALGMAGTATPLTTAVLNSVDARHVGAASGFNSAAARAGGLVATALVGGVLAARPPELVARFHVAALACAGAAALAAVSAVAFLWGGGGPQAGGDSLP